MGMYLHSGENVTVTVGAVTTEKAHPQTLRYEVAVEYASAVQATLLAYLRKQDVAGDVAIEEHFSDDTTTAVTARLIATDKKLAQLRSDISSHYSFS